MVHLIDVERVGQVPMSPSQKRIRQRPVEYSISVRPAFGRKPSVEPRLGVGGRQNHDVWLKDSIESADHFCLMDWAGRLETNHLSTGMDSVVGASRDEGLYRHPEYRGEGRFKLTLHSPEIWLAGISVEVGSVIGEVEPGHLVL